MHGAASHELFPLPLTPFESYMVADDRPAYPMAFVFCMRLSGHMNRAAWQQALGEVLPRHPLLRAHLQRVRKRGLCWVPAAECAPWSDWDLEGVPLSCPGGERIDLAREIGLRIWIRQGGDAVELTTQFHHACCDGIGALRFLGDVFAVYAARTSDAGAPALVPLSPQQLFRRGRWEAPNPLPVPVSRGQVVSTLVRETWRMLARRPVPLASPCDRSTGKPEPGPFPHIYCQTLDAPAYRQLRRAAKREEATLNDLMLGGLFQTMRQWNAQRDRDRPRNWLRITMPTDLRTREDDPMPAANVMSYAFLTRRSEDCGQATELLASIREETRAIRRWRLGGLFVEGVRLARSVPFLLNAVIGGKRCHATAVLSNLGDPSRRFSVRFPRRDERVVFGNLVLERLTAAPPLRPQTRAVFVITTYAGELTISIRCDPQLFSAADARDLLSLYVARLEQSADPIPLANQLP